MADDDWLNAFKPDTSLYDKVCLKSKELGENNDCSVIAIAIAADLDYMAVHKVLARLGRKAGSGCSSYLIRKTLQTLDVPYIERHLRQKNTNKYTPKTIELALPKGKHICNCYGHVFALVNGVVQDWTQGRNHHIKSVYTIVKTKEG